jgi:hypothetical protein
MDLTNPALVLVRRRLQLFSKQYFCRPQAKTLVLIARPGLEEMILPDPMVRIEAASEFPKPKIRTSQYRPVTSRLKHVVRALQISARRFTSGDISAPFYNGSESVSGNAIDLTFQQADFIALQNEDDPQSAVLAASLRLRNWLIADEQISPTHPDHA